MGEWEVGAFDGEEVRFLALPAAESIVVSSVLAGETGSDGVLACSMAFSVRLRPDFLPSF